MIKLRCATALTAWLLTAPAITLGACPYPEDVDIPDGSAATEQEMLAAQKQVKAYIADMEAYLKCLDEEEAALGEEVTPEQRALHVSRHNAAVDAMEQVAAQFNEQIRAYKSVND
ncbi:MAG: hypothetical protein D6727_04500 [Gammaproteobacteria bacterium]|nr:MAG: hypothetical protein D6727_04500 [Gammaproteobacteria bacterium]